MAINYWKQARENVDWAGVHGGKKRGPLLSDITSIIYVINDS